MRNPETKSFLNQEAIGIRGDEWMISFAAVSAH